MPSGSEQEIEIPPPHMGVLADHDPLDYGFKGCRDAQNLVVRNGELIVRPGGTAFGGNGSDRQMGVFQYDHSDGYYRSVKATNKGMWQYDLNTQAWVNITDGSNPLDAAGKNLPVFRSFAKAGQTWLLMTNWQATLKRWNGSSATYENAGGSPPIARCMAINANRLLLGNLKSGATISPTAIDISSDKNFDSGWGEELTLLLADTPGEIVSMMEMGNLITAVYKSDAIYMAIAQSGADPFRFEMRASKIPGPVSPLAVVEGPGGIHFYLANDFSVQVFDGTRPRSLGSDIQAYLVNNINPERANQAFGFPDTRNGDLYFIFIRSGMEVPDAGIMIHLANNSVWPLRWTNKRITAGGLMYIQRATTIGEMVGTIGEQWLVIGDYIASGLRKLVLGTVDGKILKDEGATDDGDTIPFSHETGISYLGNRLQYATIHELIHGYYQTGGSQVVNVTLGKASWAEDRVLGSPSTINLSGSQPYRTRHRTTARAFSLKLDGNASQSGIKYKGSLLLMTPRGKK